MFDETTWYPRLADVPGMDFAGSPGVDRSKLRRANLRPTKEYGSLFWETKDGESSASPAYEHVDSGREVSTRTVVKKTWEALELPGVVSDWHFLLMNTARVLWNQRTTEPEYLAECETFCRLDLQLVALFPQQFRLDKRGDQRDDDREYLSIPTFPTLVKLLRGVDDLEGALEVARTGARFNPETLGRHVVELEALLLERV